MLQKFKNLSKKQKIAVGIVGFFLLVMIGGSGESPQESIEEKTNTEEQVVTDKEYTLEEKQADFISFYNELSNIDEGARSVYEGVTLDISEAENGTKSAEEVYVSLKNAKERILERRKGFLSLQVPESLDDKKKELNELKSNYSTAYFTLANGLGDMADYMNSGDLEKYRKANENIQLYQSFTLDVSIQILEIAEELNIELSELGIDS